MTLVIEADDREPEEFAVSIQRLPYNRWPGDENRLQRLERWRSKLLDLTLRNRLLNFKHTLKTAVLIHHDIGALEDELAASTTFELHDKPGLLGSLEPLTEEAREVVDRETLRQKLQDSVQNRRLHTAYPPAEHAKRLKKIFRRARRERQEKGVNLLHISLGMLRWFDPNSPRKPRHAPLILLPVKLERQSASDRYELQMTDDEAFINQSLLQKLRKEFSIDIHGLSVLPEDASGLDVELIFKKFREAVLDMDHWDVFEDAALGIFSFGQYLMWHDLKANEHRLHDNPVVRGILDPNEDIDPQAASDEPTNEDLSQGVDFCVMEADSSQLDAVRAASRGQSYVLEGPPGTGKSQTIANVIAQCLAEQKNVLFVAEKQAALNVVYDRLESVDLDEFCLELHADNANKRAIPPPRTATCWAWNSTGRAIGSARRPATASAPAPACSRTSAGGSTASGPSSGGATRIASSPSWTKNSKSCVTLRPRR